MTISNDLAAELARLGRQLAEMQARITTLERGTNAATLGNASIEGGALTIKDGDGTPQIVLGAQADGTWAHVALPNAPVPPLPSSPVVSIATNGLLVSWDGLMNDGSPPLADFAGVQVHVSPDLYFTPGPATLQSTMIATGTRPVVGLTAGVTYYVTLLTVNAAGQLSAPTTYVGAVPLSTTEAIPPGSITADLLAADIVVAGIVDATVVNAPTLLGSTILGYAASPRRGPLAEGFEGGTGGWSGVTNATTGQDTSIFATEGVASLKITSLATGAFAATGPARATVPGDPLTVLVDVYTASILNAVYVGIRWEDVNHTLITETDCADYALGAGNNTTLTVSDTGPAMSMGALADAAWYRVVVGDHGAADVTASALYADFVRESGNIFFAASPAGGTDDLGNVYDQGVEIDSQPGATSAYTVQDAFGHAVLAAIDSSGNVTGQTASFNNASVGGQDLMTEVLPQLPLGLVAWTGIPASSLPYPSSPGTSPIVVEELDATLQPGRHYMLVLEMMNILLNAAGGVQPIIYATTDGSTPSTSSPAITRSTADYIGTSGNVRTNPIIHSFDTIDGGLWRFLLYLQTVFTSANMQIQAINQDPGDDLNTTMCCRMAIYDMGPTVPVTGAVILTGGTSGSSTPPPKTYVKTYGRSHSYCYQGSDGGNPNLKINQDSTSYQGGDFGNTYNGRAKTFFLMPSSIASDLAGASISKVEVYLNNNHTWYGSGMTAAIGWSTDTSFGSTKGDPTAHDSVSTTHFNQGQAKWTTVSNAIGVAFRDSGARCITLFRNSNDLTYYGFFSSSSMQLRITYVK